MAKPSFEQWKRQTLGKKIDLDNGSLDCVDVAKSWAEFVHGKPWTQSLSWGNAKDIWHNVSAAFWERSSTPRVGAIVCMGGGIGGGFGHVAVVVAVNGNNITVYQQDTFKQVAVYTGVFDARASYIQGYLYPKAAFTLADEPELKPNQRVVGGVQVAYRKAPAKSGELIDWFDPGATANFKGFVRGENVEGNNLWFVGELTSGYSWSGGYTDMGTHDLADLTPATLKSTERQIAGDAMNLRRTPQVEPNNVIQLLGAGTVHEFDGWKRGFAVDGNDVWFRHKSTGGFVWSGGFIDRGTHDLSEITDGTKPSEPETPVYPAPTNDPSVTAVYNKKRPLGYDYEPTDLVDVGNSQRLRKEAAASLSLMQKAALKDGATLSPQSGFRSYSAQKALYDNYVKEQGQEKADTFSARPGYSEHQTGLTMDFAPIDDAFKIGAAYKWLVKNAHKYGWVLRYPEGKDSVTGYMYEPWHWRYVGVDAATDMYTHGEATLEEYYGIQGGGYPVADPKPDPEPEPEPKPEPEKPEEKATKEAAKAVGRQGILVALGQVLAVGGDWVLNMIFGLNMPMDLQVAMGGLFWAILLFADKWIHENVKIKLRGIVGF